MAKTVVVLGMHRSGTSAVAGMLHKLGVNMGDNLYPPDHGNPQGHFEDIDFMEANTAILRAAGGEWHNPPSDFQIRVFGAREGQQVIDLINERNDKRSIWGFKDPRTCLTLPLYLPHLTDPLFVVVDRCCKEVANSLHRRDGIAFHHQHDNEALCEEYKSRLESGLRLVERSAILRLQFSNVLNAPQEVASFLARAIGTSPTELQFSTAVELITQR